MRIFLPPLHFPRNISLQPFQVQRVLVIRRFSERLTVILIGCCEDVRMFLFFCEKYHFFIVRNYLVDTYDTI